MSRRRLSHRWPRFFRTWHRKLALVSGVALIYWLLTGFALNHAHDFALDKRQVKQTWLLDWYGIRSPESVVFIQTGKLSWAKADDLLFLPDGHTVECNGRLLGAGRMDKLYWGICGTQLWFFDRNGQQLESIDLTSMLGARPVRVGQTEQGQLVVEAANQIRYATLEGWEWSKMDSSIPVAWRHSKHLDLELAQQWSKRYRSHWLTWERVIQDMHSGRFFGLIGLWLVDIVFLLLCFSSISGLYLWQKSGRS